MDKALLMAKHRALFPDNKFRSISREYYEWKIYKNPVREGDIFLETRDGRVVGSSTLMPRKIAILNEIFSAAETADSFTLPEYRRQGINSKALKYCIEYAISHNMNIIYGPPNQANYGLHLKLGYLPCSFINYNFLTKSLKPIFFMIRLILKIIARRDVHYNYRKLIYILKRKSSQRKGFDSDEIYIREDFNVIKIDKFNTKLDGLWGTPRYLFYILRDSSYLNWRYCNNPDKYTILAAIKDKEYLGYIVLKISKDNSTGILCDFITVNDRQDIFWALVKKAEQILKRSGTELIQLRCIVDSPYYNILNKLGYYDHGPESYQPICIYSKTELGKRVLEKSGRWHFTLGDSDEV
jgi:GNAT superfamily N-acetyltransferase